MPHKINICIHSSLKTTDWDIGKQILEAFISRGEKLTPQTLWSFNKKVADFTNIPDVEDHWARLVITKSKNPYYYSEHYTGLTWKRRKTLQHQANMEHTSRNKNKHLHPGYFSFRGTYSKTVDWESLFDELTAILQSEKAFIQMHDKAEPELRTLVYQDKLDDLPNISIIPKTINAGPTRKITLIGSELASKIEKEGFRIKPQANAYRVKICRNFHDAAENYSEYAERKAYLKSLFPKSIFRVKGKLGP